MKDQADNAFPGSGEMAARCRAFEWATTPLGPASGWTQSLRTTVRTMLASRHPMLLFWGPSLIQLYNDAYRPSFGEGWRHPRALGTGARDFWTDTWQIIGPQIDGVMQRGEATWREDQLVPIARNGRLEMVHWTYGYSPVYDDDGTIGGALVLCTETTPVVQSVAAAAQEALALVFAQAPVAIAVLHGRELRYTVANPKYQHIIGNRDPVGKTMTEMFPALAGSEIERVLQNVHDTGVSFVAKEILIRFDSHGTGEIDNYYDLVYQPVTTPEGTVTGIVVVATDVTERRRILLASERHLVEAERAQAEAEVANQAKTTFLAMMSHGLRTPLNAIAGYADLVDMGILGPVTPEQHTALESIHRSERHLFRLIEGLLEYAKLGAGAVHYEMAEVRLGEVLAACEELMAPQMRAKQLDLRVAGGEARVTARADREKVQQVLLNLLSNAIKFSEPDGRITLTCFTGSDGRAIARVKDTGCGIAADQFERVFQPFTQVDATLTRTTDGTGLGLAISRDLARGMGGDVTLECEPGAGCTFTLSLPSA